jgi:ferrous iron transport protein A
LRAIHWRAPVVIDNASHLSLCCSLDFADVRLDQLPLNSPARISAIAWDAVEAVHHAPFGKDPIACRVGRMTIALRRAQAQAISVETIAA